MHNMDKGDAALKNSIDSKIFETDMIPIFEKIKIEKNEAFYIPSMGDIQEYESLFYNIYHGIVYNFFRKVEKRKRLSYDEYIFLYENALKVRVFNGERTVYYGGNAIVVISKYTEPETERLCEYIKPVYSDDIEQLLVVKKPEITIENRRKQEEQRDEILRKSKKYLNEKRDINFDNFD